MRWVRLTEAPLRHDDRYESKVARMNRVKMGLRMVAAADGAPSRARLLRYFVRNATGRALAPIRPHRRLSGVRTLDFRLGGVEWSVRADSSQLGGIHDVWLAREYDASPGFRAVAGELVVDIGANVGAYALWQWSNMQRSGHVLAFEASPTTAAVLRGNVDRNGAGQHIVVEERAVWTETGTVEFVQSERTSSTAGVSATVDMSLVSNSTVVVVPALSLDDVLAHDLIGDREVAVLKLDVEGAELSVLAAASVGSLARVRRIVVESDERTWGPVVKVLDQSGFTCVGRYRNVGYFEAPRSPSDRN
jgi:FkbM family methyltransferase